MNKNGIIIINKSKNCTSHDIVYKVKKIFGQKVGHTGTLDPMATGVLPILIGTATKMSKYLINHDKIYKVTLKLGEKTDTADTEGKIIEKQNVSENILENEYIEKILNSFIGKQTQIPPIYSAIKVKGKKLYEYARKGEKVEIQPRNIEIYFINLQNIEKETKQIIFEVSCSKGTYIRSLCEDIAEKLGTIGYMKELQRTQVGEFDIKEAITIEDLEENKENEKFINNNLKTIEDICQKFKEINLESQKLEYFLNGVKLSIKKEDGIYRIYCENKFLGTGIIKDNKLKRDIII